MNKYPEYKQLNMPEVAKQVGAWWEDAKVFERSIAERNDAPSFTFYEGPPSANGLPGIHHVMARAIKDIFCRYKTQKGYRVERKAGWDTHGLPIELAVEKTLGIKKEDIGTKITVEEYNAACRKEVMKYTDRWEELTRIMGYWVDMQNPYVTYENKYIESVWWLLQQLYNKGLLYKGYTIQPYSPAAGTGLSSHELNQPGCYRNVKDTSAVAMFELVDVKSIHQGAEKVYAIAWTTTPWTLPSNTALAVGPAIDYCLVKTYQPHTHAAVVVIVAEALLSKYFPEKNAQLDFDAYQAGDKEIPFQVLKKVKGAELNGLRYHQLLPFAQPEDGDAFRIITGDFVTTEDGTGIVHIAPSFGSDDFRVARQNGIGSLTLVDKRGKFIAVVSDGIFLYGDEYVKEAYLSDEEKDAALALQKEKLQGIIKDTSKLQYLSVDDRIVLKLQQEGKLFKKEKYEHNYPHCWRTDKPVIYYPLDSWFVAVTKKKDSMIALNKQINWKPESTGTGRFGNWLENANDWNLSRSRFWGIPLPIWRSEDGEEVICIGSVAELKAEIDKAIDAGVMQENPLQNFVPGDNSKENYDTFDLHKPYADQVVLISPKGNKMYRESDLIDVWFDSGAMPYAQQHYPFENKEKIDGEGKAKAFPADFIAEGVDQTRGWFYTLHAIASLVFDQVAYKNVISNGLVLDKNGNKMSKRLGNAVDPFVTIAKYGPDATRWYMITNAQPWDNLKFNEDGIVEVQRKFFGTLYNTYAFFALYANIDGFTYQEADLDLSKRPEIDRWVLSRLNSLIAEVDAAYADYEPTKAGRAIADFVNEQLSNWYVRLCRRRFWKGEYSEDKISAYQTLYTCLDVVARLMAPIAPFFADRLYRDLNAVTQKHVQDSVHLSAFPKADTAMIDADLESRMDAAQQLSSIVLALRKKVNIRVRQPLRKILVPVSSESFKARIEAVQNLILSETNVKEMEYVNESSGMIVKKAKADFKALGPKYGKLMKQIAQEVAALNSDQVYQFERDGNIRFTIEGQEITLLPEDVEIQAQDIPGWLVGSGGGYTLALDITIDEALKKEGLARELVNKIQNMRKDAGFEVTDRIDILVKNHPELTEAVKDNLTYICAETLGSSLLLTDNELVGEKTEILDDIKTVIRITKNKGL
ncbi:MAG: isoleucine--tRNA ligase [Flavobacteriales bacterium]